jgi:hypothetical protein
MPPDATCRPIVTTESVAAEIHYRHIGRASRVTLFLLNCPQSAASISRESLSVESSASRPPLNQIDPCRLSGGSRHRHRPAKAVVPVTAAGCAVAPAMCDQEADRVAPSADYRRDGFTIDDTRHMQREGLHQHGHQPDRGVDRLTDQRR